MGALARTSWFNNVGALRSIIIITIALNLTLVGFLVGGNQTLHEFIRPFGDKSAQSIQLHNGASSGTAGLKSEKVAMIVETRMLDNLVPLMLHFSSVLGPSWHVTLFTLESVWKMPPSARFQQLVKQGQFSVQFMPPKTSLTDWRDVNVFLTRPWLWQQVRAARRILMFQSDSIICSNSRWTADDFLEWDYIGAPVSQYLGGVGYNGGLSLRNPQMILDVLANPTLNDFDWQWDHGHLDKCIEDNFYYRKMNESGVAKLPDPDTAGKFSVESAWYDRPFGFHAPRVWNRDRMDEIWQYCPEVEMINRDHKKALQDLTPEEQAGFAALSTPS